MLECVCVLLVNPLEEDMRQMSKLEGERERERERERKTERLV